MFLFPTVPFFPGLHCLARLTMYLFQGEISMYLSPRSKVSIFLSMITLLGVVGSMLVVFISYRTTYAATHAVTVQYNGTPGTATRLSTSRPALARTVPGAGRHV